MNEYAQKIRRELHKNPEIGFDLPKTLTTLRRELDEVGVEYTEKFGKSGIVATINPEKSHFTIGIRADMDALPILEKNDVPYTMLVPLMILAVLSVLLGAFPGMLTELFTQLSAVLL